jgi:hypothetical protein
MTLLPIPRTRQLRWCQTCGKRREAHATTRLRATQLVCSRTSERLDPKATCCILVGCKPFFVYAAKGMMPAFLINVDQPYWLEKRSGPCQLTSPTLNTALPSSFADLGLCVRARHQVMIRRHASKRWCLRKRPKGPTGRDVRCSLQPCSPRNLATSTDHQPRSLATCNCTACLEPCDH